MVPLACCHPWYMAIDLALHRQQVKPTTSRHCGGFSMGEGDRGPQTAPHVPLVTIKSPPRSWSLSRGRSMVPASPRIPLHLCLKATRLAGIVGCAVQADSWGLDSVAEGQ